MNSFAQMLGMPISADTTCFVGSFSDGMAIVVNGKEYFLRYTDFPWFEYCSVAELRKITSDRWGVYWDLVDIDLSIESIENPEHFPEKIKLFLETSNGSARTLGLKTIIPLSNSST